MLSLESLNTTNNGAPSLEVRFEDFFGVDIEKNDVLVIHSSKFDSGCCSGPKKDYRVLDKKSYNITSCRVAAEAYKDQIMKKFNEYLASKQSIGVCEEDRNSYTPEKMPYSWNKKAMAIISGKSGSGKAQKYFNEIEPTLKANGFILEPILTESKTHATEILRDMPVEKLKTYYCFMFFSGDGVVTEGINGFYQRGKDQIKEHNLIFRVISFIGGSANTMARFAARNYQLDLSLWNCVYTATRSKFEPLPVFAFEYASTTDNYATIRNVWGWHSMMIGGSGDIVEKSEAYRWCGGETRYTIAIMQVMLCNRKDRTIKFWWSEERVEPMPGLNDEIPEDGKWKYTEMTVSDLLAAFYPICTRDFVITKRIKMGNDLAVVQACPSEGGFSGYKKWLGDGQNGIGLDDSKWGESKLARSFRVELNDPKWGEKDTPLAFDGGIYRGSKLQGRFDECFVRQMF